MATHETPAALQPVELILQDGEDFRAAIDKIHSTAEKKRMKRSASTPLF